MPERVIAANKVVYITYSVVNEAGMVVQQHDVPIGYVHGGESGLFDKIEQALEGHAPGDRVEVTLAPDEGFGAHDPDLTYTDDIDNVPPEYRYIGAEVTFQNDAGETRDFRVTRIADGKLTIDGNNPLAGQTVVCVVDVLEVRDATLDEIANGAPAEAGQPPSYH